MASETVRDAAADLAVCAAATPPPWKAARHGHDFQGVAHTCVVTLAKDTPFSEADADFCALARDALPYWIERARQWEWYAKDVEGVNEARGEWHRERHALLARAEAAEAERDRLRGIVESLAGYHNRPGDPVPVEAPTDPALEIQTPTRDQADVREEYRGQVVELEYREGAARKCRVVRRDRVARKHVLSGWCASEAAAWKSAAKQVREKRGVKADG